MSGDPKAPVTTEMVEAGLAAMYPGCPIPCDRWGMEQRERVRQIVSAAIAQLRATEAES